ncbi:hypothetical protein [Brevundimonas sp. LjRoot202]|uniref:hypothetical protein n=1 Tax=Brevundimonas sp. LjRoot202 TaxID=3342281 RepID=UPI003ECFD1FD
MRALFRKAVILFYWLILPLVVLACLGGIPGVIFNPAAPRSWLTILGAAAFAGLVCWRLWLNSRAVGWGGPMPSARRLLLVFAPLAAIALAGLVLMVLGLGWLAYGFWLADADFGAAAVGPLIGGVLALAAGAALIAPLALHLRRRPAKDSF